MNKKYAKLWLFEADNGGGSGGGESVFSGSEAPQGEGAASSPAEGAAPGEGVADGGAGGQGSQGGEASWTPEKITQLIAEAAKAGAAQPKQAEQQQQMSLEEIQQRLNAFTPTEQHIADLLEGGPKSVAAMKAIVDGAVKHATTVAWYQTQYAYNQLAEQINPMRSFYEQQQVENLRNEFYTKNPDLRGKEKLLSAVKASLDQEGAFNGKSKDQGFAMIAQRARQILQAAGNGEGTSGGSSGMASLSRGSQHGSSASKGGGGAAPSDAEAIFGG